MKGAKNVYVAGHNGMLGQAFMRMLTGDKDYEIFTIDRKELDLRSELDVKYYFEKHKFDLVIIAAAKVGGVLANQNYPADFIFDNLKIQTNLIHQSYLSGVQKIIFLASCCIYPRDCPQPMNEKHILSGPLEKTNEPYALAKLAGINMCQSYYSQYNLNSFCPMPINLYGPFDNFDPFDSHVIAGLMNRIHLSKINHNDTCEVWGTGTAKREYMHVDDCVKGIMYLNDLIHDGSMINISPGIEMTTFETAEMISKVIGYKGKLILDETKPDGTPRKLADSKKIKSLGWEGPQINFENGLVETYKWYLKNIFFN